MKKWIKIAFLNVVRNKRRSSTAILTIAISFCALAVADSYLNFTFWGLKQSIIQGGVGNFQIADKRLFDDFEDTPLEFGLTTQQSNETIDNLVADKNISKAMQRISISGIISGTSGEITTIFSGLGVQPKQEASLRQGNVSGSFQSGGRLRGENIYQVVLAKDLARKIKANVGDNVTLLSTTVDGAINALDAKVVGIYVTGIPERDAIELKVPLGFAKELLQTDKVSRIVVKLRDIDQTDAIAPVVDNIIASNLKAKTWYELQPYFKSVENVFYSIFFFMGTIIILVVLFASSNVIYTSVMERVFEIGTMRSFGVSKAKLKFCFMVEGFFIGLLGAITGVIFFIIIVLAVNQYGYIMPPPPGRSLGYPLFLLPNITSDLIIIGIIITFCVTASYFPINGVLKKKIVDQINYV